MFLNIQSFVTRRNKRQKNFFLDVFVLFCRASFRDENFTSAKIVSASQK